MLPAVEANGCGGEGGGEGGYENDSAALEGILKRCCCFGPLGRRRRQVITQSG